MSDALRNFLQERDPYGHGLEFVVDQHDLEALLEGHKAELEAGFACPCCECYACDPE